MQITAVNLVRALTRIHVPHKVIADLADNRTPEKVIKVLDSKRSDILEEIRYWQEAYSVIEVFLKLLDEGIHADENQIAVREMSEMRIAMGDNTHFIGSN